MPKQPSHRPSHKRSATESSKNAEPTIRVWDFVIELAGGDRPSRLRNATKPGALDNLALVGRYLAKCLASGALQQKARFEEGCPWQC